MPIRKACFECLQGLRKNKQQELIDSEAHRKTLDYITYHDSICNGCAKFLVSPKGDYAGAPIESIKHVMFLHNHFKNLYFKIKREMPDDEDTQMKWKLIIDNRNKYTAQTMARIHADLDNLVDIVTAISDNIYEGVVGRKLVYKNRMLVGDIKTGHPYKTRK